MNRYHDAMERCAPPPELETRLREAVLAAKPQKRPAAFRPRGFFRKAVLAAALAAVLTVSAGAAVVANWDAILTSRFGAWAASTPMGQAAFQEVYVSSVCGDVTLTVRQALVSEKTVYLILDYQLPDTLDQDLRDQLASREDSDSWVRPPSLSYYLTGDFTWEELKAADQSLWETIDWSDYLSYADYVDKNYNALRDYRLVGPNASGASSGMESRGYDPDTNTLTYLCQVTAESEELDFTRQPLTLLASPPALVEGETATALADHPALLTFQPEAVGQTLTGSWRENGRAIQVTVSPFAISVEASGGTPYQELRDLKRDTSLVFQDGTIQPVAELTMGSGAGGSRGGEGNSYTSISFTSQFRELFDVSQAAAVRVGDVEISLT